MVDVARPEVHPEFFSLHFVHLSWRFTIITASPLCFQVEGMTWQQWAVVRLSIQWTVSVAKMGELMQDWMCVWYEPYLPWYKSYALCWCFATDLIFCCREENLQAQQLSFWQCLSLAHTCDAVSVLSLLLTTQCKQRAHTASTVSSSLLYVVPKELLTKRMVITRALFICVWNQICVGLQWVRL